LETNEVIARGIETRIGSRTNDELRKGGGELHAVLSAWTRDLKQLQSVWIWDEAGRPIATNLRPDPPAALNVSDREYFVWARDHNAPGWYVSAPLRSRTTNELFFDFAKRRTGTDGRFLGAVSVSLRPAYFDAFFREQVSKEMGFTLSLLRADGTVISRFPAAPSGPTPKLGSSSPLLAAMSSNAAEGVVQGVSTLDGEYRYVAYRRIADLPLYAASTATRSGMLIAWRKSMLLLTAFTLPLALGLAGICGFAISRVRREHAIALAHKEQYEQLLKAEDALRLAQKMEALGRLTGGVAHDFNNILMVVQSSVSLARKLQLRDQPLDRALAPIERAVATGAQLTRQLLAVVRRQPLQIRTFEIAEVIPAIGQLMTSTLGRSVTVTHDVGPGLFVTVDQAELELALINLCINAKDAMADGGVIAITARESQPPVDALPSSIWVRITVSDPGEGIPSEILSRVTEPFFTTKPLGKGTGLGLSQVNSFVTQVGGRLEIESEPGRGTRVSLLLPCAIATPVEASSTSLPDTQRRFVAHVLLVEDNPDIAQAVSAALQDAGAKVTWHATADSAADAIAQGTPFDVVLSDVSLPGQRSGIDLARELKAELPVVLMTGYTDRLQEAIAAGYRVVPKPATPDVLLEALIEAAPAFARS
jgi:signal transduction histidine kinase